MEARASLPVSLPHPNPTTSYWQEPPDLELADYQSSENLPGQVVDTVIIGSGITGASVAWHLLQSEDNVEVQAGVAKKQRIVMLEARQTCSGATGRNGGHTKAASYRSFPSNLQLLGKEEAIKIARLEYANIQATHNFATQHDIECESRSCDTVDIIYDAKQWEECISAIRLMKECLTETGDEKGVGRYQLYTPEEARGKFHVKGRGMEGEEILGAVSYEAGSKSAYKFTIGVLKLCLEKGLELFTNTAVTKVKKAEDGDWGLVTKKGAMRAKRIVVATNGHTAALLRQFQGSIVPLRGQVTAHRPCLNKHFPRLETTYSFIYSNGYEYMIPRPPASPHPGDIVIGGGLVKAPNEGLAEYGTTDDCSLNPIISKYLHQTTATYFGEPWCEIHEDGRIRKEWTGIMGYSPDGFPFVGSVPAEIDGEADNEGLWITAGFQGHGMVMCWESGRALIEIIEGRDGEELRSWFPDIFRVTKERMEKRFRGRLHTVPMNVENSS